MSLFTINQDQGLLRRQAKAVFTGCLIAMAAVLAYGAYLDTKEEMERKAAEGEEDDLDYDDIDFGD